MKECERRLENVNGSRCTVRHRPSSLMEGDLCEVRSAKEELVVEILYGTRVNDAWDKRC